MVLILSPQWRQRSQEVTEKKTNPDPVSASPCVLCCLSQEDLGLSLQEGAAHAPPFAAAFLSELVLMFIEMPVKNAFVCLFVFSEGKKECETWCRKGAL